MCIFSHGRYFARSQVIDGTGKITETDITDVEPSYMPYRRVQSLPSIPTHGVGYQTLRAEPLELVYRPRSYVPAENFQSSRVDFSSGSPSALTRPVSLTAGCAGQSTPSLNLPCIAYTPALELPVTELTHTYKPYIREQANNSYQIARQPRSSYSHQSLPERHLDPYAYPVNPALVHKETISLVHQTQETTLTQAYQRKATAAPDLQPRTMRITSNPVPEGVNQVPRQFEPVQDLEGRNEHEASSPSVRHLPSPSIQRGSETFCPFMPHVKAMQDQAMPQASIPDYDAWYVFKSGQEAKQAQETKQR